MNAILHTRLPLNLRGPERVTFTHIYRTTGFSKPRFAQMGVIGKAGRLVCYQFSLALS